MPRQNIPRNCKVVSAGDIITFNLNLEPVRKTIEDALAKASSDSINVAKNGQQISSSPHLPSGKLPDQLLYVNLRNVGHVPSHTVKASIVVPGQIADKTIKDAGSAFGKVDQIAESDSTGEFSFECQNFANDPTAIIKVAIWYERTSSGSPSVQVQDTSEGPAREVDSVDTARFYWWEWQPLRFSMFIVIAALYGILAGIAENKLFALIDRHRARKSLTS